ncbi:MAG: NAD(P)-dependent oxidoreductase [Candidatus Aenigmatarchaeota archaeon]
MILITGANGFIGTNLTKRLIKDGYSVRLFCRDVSTTKKRFPKADVVKGDITHRDTLKQAMKGVSKVVHLAGLVSYTTPESEMFRINVHGTKNVIEASGNVNKLVFASSVAVMGHIKGIADEMYMGRPAHTYGRTKLEAEKLVLDSGINNVCLRMAPIYGAGSESWIKPIRLIEKGFPMPNIKNNMHGVHISDVVQAFERGLNKGSGVYIIADNYPTRLTVFTGMIAAYLGRKQKIWPVWMVSFLACMSGKKREFDAFIVNRHYNISKAREELKYEPKQELEKGVKDMVNWYKKM